MFDVINGLVEASYAWYEHQPPIIQLTVGILLIRNILLKWASDEIRHFIFEPIGLYIRRNIIEGKHDRRLVIEAHVFNRHKAPLKHCQEDACSILGLLN